MAFIPYYILILFVTIAIDYYAGIKIEENAGRKKKLYLIVSIVSTCLVLIIFKYYNFFITNIQDVAVFFHWNISLKLLGIILPIGLSFHTFQSLSYVIEVYRGKQKAERNFGIYSLYVMFYPQLVAGPIERPQNLLHQFYEEHQFEYSRVTHGLQRMLWGFFKKIVIADNLAFYVNKVFDVPHAFEGLAFVFATFFFAIQIYCDFSGYSDIAIGSAEVMGFRLMTNFKNPYFSLSIPEFWSRWHISLSTWFKDYLYIPLGGNRVSKVRWACNMVVTFLVSGFWHGANWTYILWGLIHGVYTVLSNSVMRIFGGINFHIHKFVVVFFEWFTTFSLVLFAWIFFRARSVHEALYIAGHGLSGLYHVLKGIIAIPFTRTLDPLQVGLNQAVSPLPSVLYLIVFIGIVVFLACIEWIDYRADIIDVFRKQNVWLRWLVYICFVLAIMNLGVTKAVPFIYFQF